MADIGVTSERPAKFGKAAIGLAWTRFAAARRMLARFWGAAALLLGVGAGILQWLGPPAHAPAVAARPMAVASPASPAAPVSPAAPPATAAEPSHTVAAAEPEPADSPEPQRHVIAAPDPALLEPAPDFPDGKLPRIGPGSRMPMRVYAAAAEPAAGRPRIAILLAGVGLSEQATTDAIIDLPSPVSFAVSPYATISAGLLDAARTRGHELLVSIPMEPQGYPVNDAGVRALLTGATAAANARALEWALSRFGGYVGATAALGHLRGDRFSASPGQMQPVLAELAARGLLYIDARPGAKPPDGPPVPPFQAIDVVIDEPLARAEIDGKLARLEQIAGERGFAIGLIGAPAPVINERISAWAVSLPPRGILLTPVSALVRRTGTGTGTGTGTAAAAAASPTH